MTWKSETAWPSRPIDPDVSPWNVRQTGNQSGKSQGREGAGTIIRRALRRPFPLTALINFGLHYSRLWPVRDLSPTGAYVEMNIRGLSVGTRVEFVLRYAANGCVVEHRLAACVERIEEHGVGLGFDAYADETYTDLVRFLYSS